MFKMSKLLEIMTCDQCPHMQEDCICEETGEWIKWTGEWGNKEYKILDSCPLPDKDTI